MKSIVVHCRKTQRCRKNAYMYDILKIRILDLQSIPRESNNKDVAAMLVELTIEANEESFVIVHQHGGNDVNCNPRIANINVTQRYMTSTSIKILRSRLFSKMTEAQWAC